MFSKFSYFIDIFELKINIQLFITIICLLDMKKILILLLLILFTFNINAQTRKIFLEEFNGAWCGYCVYGTYYIDSLLEKYPEQLISVSCHTDSLRFAEIDTLSNGYSVNGVPSAAIDRVYHPQDTSLGILYGAVYHARTVWDTLIKQRLFMPPNLTIDIDSLSWDSISRDIHARINIDIISSLPIDDYRVGLYIVEDSVVYDQVNAYNSVIGHPFYGQGDPIVGYNQRRVARALLPTTWGQLGSLPSSLLAGQDFTRSFNYNLPNTFNQDQIYLIAFVYRFSHNHQNDEVLNVNQVSLNFLPTIINDNKINNEKITLYPNPTTGIVNIEGNNYIKVFVINSNGNIVEIINNKKRIDLSNQPNGLYILKIITNKEIVKKKVIKY